MEDLIKDMWNKDNLSDYYKVLDYNKNEDKIEWEKNIVNTNYSTLAIKADIQRNIAKNIFKGNYISFLDMMNHIYYDDLIVNAYTISLIKDYKMQIKYINKLSKYIDSWAVVDALKYSIKNHEEEYFNYALDKLSSKQAFDRRIGIRILFSYIELDQYSDKIFSILDSLNSEEEYYVNMAAAWLLCELMIKKRDKTISYYKGNKTNKFIINKSISKCRDSYRVSKEDKELLLNFKK